MSNTGDSSSPPRHWHGTFGDRYEHHNVWVTGGPPTAYRRPSFPESSPIDRWASATAAMSSSSSNSNNPVDSHANPPTVQDNRRRSSGHGPSTLFESLTNQKRKSSDVGATARRASYNEQGIKGNYFSKLWDEYTRGK